jgi:hypothetical protein
MFTYPDALWSQVQQRQHELIADAEKFRLLVAARRRRRERSRAGADATVRGRPTGTLAPCGSRAAQPAR